VNNAGILRDRSFARMSDMDWGNNVCRLLSFFCSYLVLLVSFSCLVCLYFRASLRFLFIFCPPLCLSVSVEVSKHEVILMVC